LPIVITGADNIRADDPREEVRIIEARNYENLQSAWLAGYDSAEWRTAMFTMAQKLDASLIGAEARLASREQGPQEDDDGSSIGEPPEIPGGSGGEVDALQLQERMEEFAAQLGRIQGVLERFAEIATSELGGNVDFSNLPRKQQMTTLIRLSEAIGPVSQELGEEGRNLKDEAVSLDAELRSFFEELKGISSDLVDPQALVGDASTFSGIAEVMSAMNQLVDMLKVAALMNVSLRRALRPAIDGIRSINMAASIFQSWSNLGDQD
jgi:hypothetical protein